MKPKISNPNIESFDSVNKPFKHMSAGYTLEYEKGIKNSGRMHLLKLSEVRDFCMQNRIRPEDVVVYKHSPSGRRKMFAFEYAFANYSGSGERIKTYLTWQKVVDTDIAHITLQKEDFPERHDFLTTHRNLWGDNYHAGENIHFIVRYKSPKKQFFTKIKEKLIMVKNWLLYNLSKWN